MKKKFTTMIEENIINKLKIKAILKNKSAGEIIEELVLKYLEEL